MLAYAYLIIALHTGGNVTPLLEMTHDCLRPHPKADTSFLVLFKRRGHSTKGIVINDGKGSESVIESLPTVRPTVAKLVRRVIELSSRLREDAPDYCKSRVWLYRVRVSLRRSKRQLHHYLTTPCLRAVSASPPTSYVSALSRIKKLALFEVTLAQCESIASKTLRSANT